MVTRMKRNSIVAAALVGCLLAKGAFAATPGFYVTATAGTGDEDPKSNGTNVSNGFGIVHVDPDDIKVNDGSFAWGIGIGYRINSYLAAELEYADFGTTDIDEHYIFPNPGPFPFPTEFDAIYSSKVTGPAVSLLGTFPVAKSFELFLRGGALFASREYTTGGPVQINAVDEKFASTVWLAGGGASWSFAKRWGIRAEYQQSGSLDSTVLTGETRVKRVSMSVLFRL
jgi:opacity protein-like surface antigen